MANKALTLAQFQTSMSTVSNYVNSKTSNKVDKVSGKDLSTNDFTDEAKNKLDGLENYDDTELRNLVQNADVTYATDEEVNSILNTYFGA